MTSHDHNQAGREHLSALFDGELDGDAARFALKRLVRDPQWQDACGNWQLAGDVLRGRSTIAAPGDFASRVQVALAGELAAPVAVVPSGRHASRKWMGGAALAASMAAAALFIARPDQASIPDRAQPVPLVAAASEAAPAPVTAQEIAPPADQPRIQVAVAQPSASRETRSPSRRVTRAPRAGVQSASMPMAVTATVGDGMSGDNPSLRPFQEAADRIAVRPWPRAVLPGYAAAGTLTAGFDAQFQGSDDESPSFYPFEPRLPMNSPDAASPQP